MDDKDALFVDGWQIDAASHRIARDGVEVRIEPRSMDLLLYLARCPDRVISREELEEHVWHGRVVGYQALSGAIVKLRKAFGDTSKNHHVIETVPKGGYRLIAPVLPQCIKQASFASNLTRVTSPKIWAAAVVATIAFVFATSGIQQAAPVISAGTVSKTHLPLTTRPSIAVLPFSSVPEDSGLEDFAFGVSEDLTTDLSRLSGILVISGNALQHYRNRVVNIQQIAAELRVRYVLQGSVRGAGGQLRVNTQLIDAATGGHLWGQRYDGRLDDAFAFQDEVTRKIVMALSARLMPDEHIQRAQRNTSNPQAYEAFLQASQLQPFESAEEFRKTVRFFKRAIELDPSYSNAHAALALLYWRVTSDGWAKFVGISYSQAMYGVYDHARKAKEHPTPAAHRIRALINTRQGLWDDAIDELLLAISLDPNDSDSMATMSSIQLKMGRPTIAQIYLNEGMRLDPVKKCYWLRASIKFHLEQYDEAVRQLRVFVEDAPNNDWLHLLLAASYGHLGKFAEGSAEIQRFNELWAKKGHSRIYTASMVAHWAIQDDATRKRIRDGLLKAGMPEF